MCFLRYDLSSEFASAFEGSVPDLGLAEFGDQAPSLEEFAKTDFIKHAQSI